MYGLFNSQSIFSALVRNRREIAAVELHALDDVEFGDEAVASSIVMTPSLPTFCIACAIHLAISRRHGGDRPDLAISALVEIFFRPLRKSLTTEATAMSMPARRSVGSCRATALTPSRTIAWARTVASSSRRPLDRWSEWRPP